MLTVVLNTYLNKNKSLLDRFLFILLSVFFFGQITNASKNQVFYAVAQMLELNS